MENLTHLFASVLIALNLSSVPTQNQPSDPPDTLGISQPVKTESKFTEKVTDQTETIPKKTVYVDDPETEAGVETVLEEGSDGKIVKTIKTTYYDNAEYLKEVTDTQTTPSTDKKISRGTKVIWKTLDSNDGQISYYKKLHVWATHYDSHCLGCNDWTATGLRAGKGVIAVDPKVIKLGSKVYIPGYGQAIAGDTGGSIKGNIIDLGFDDAKTSGWSAHYIDIYLL